jgi:AraC family transcriptional regulator
MVTGLFADTMARALALALLRRRSTARLADAHRRMFMTPRQLRAAIDYIESHLGQNLSLESLRRIERAKELLRSQRREIADVANLVGFSTQSHFTSVFHRQCGITPKRFRDSHPR